MAKLKFCNNNKIIILFFTYVFVECRLASVLPVTIIFSHSTKYIDGLNNN